MKTNVEIGLKSHTHFRENLKWFRENEHLTQSKLGELVGSNQKNISAYEAGRATPSPELLIKMADAFGISVDELIRVPNCKKSIREFNPVN